MKIEPEAKSLIGPSVYPTLLKLGTIQFFFPFQQKKGAVVTFSPYFTYYKHYFSLLYTITLCSSKLI